MNIIISDTKKELGKKAAQLGAEKIKDTIDKKGEANIIVATGASQFEMLEELIKADLEWEKVTGFHLDEYIGLSESHPASFRKYLRERFVEKVNLSEFNYVNGEVDPQQECNRLNNIISQKNIDVAFIGIGENAHIAFNDPPADFKTTEPYIVVNLDEDCRKQQLGEGWFSSFEDVPKKAISMSINQILKSELIICCVPDSRKADAVRRTIEKEISPNIPSTILNNHNNVYLFLDNSSASMLKEV
ncbi:MAG: glucosamine-6-phosphate deaminase [Ignavibacteriales bacterium]|nr:glucosamine-6-phosphate deaminase [Ignavibacteriales bacterium]MCB9218320.1 glucosamine-6-phosphate deaminase [Ignavibacteriales bacterium]MCB9260616.1 glucosamine-6-phosphate deaminase [Ignavibacteriales bacterium]